MIYEFTKIDLDTYKLVYTDKNGKQKEIEFKRTIELAKKLEETTANARFKLYEFLSSRNKTKEDFIVKRSDGKGHTTYDESNYVEFENKFIEEQSAITIDEIMKSCFKMSMYELMEDMIQKGISEKAIKEQSMMFGQKFRTVIINGIEDKKDIPSGDNTEQKNIS